jgi:hypothetical protein
MFKDIYTFPIKELKLSRCEMITTLNYHRRLERIANPEVDSSCGPVRSMLLVTCAEPSKARYIGYTVAGKQIIEEVAL